MTGLKKALTSKNIISGWMYFYIHFAMEVLCFFCLKQQIAHADVSLLWLFPFVYDALAFVPQAVVGYINDRFPKFNAGLTGIILMVFAALSFWLGILPGKYPALIVLCAGNALTHVGGAEVTIRSSGGRLAHPAVFVAGGAFGVITGTLLSGTNLPYIAVIIFLLSAVPFAVLAQKFRFPDVDSRELCKGFNYAKKGIPVSVILFVSVLVVAVRAYMGYCLPMAWKTTALHSVLLYVAMGVGKAAGGIFADAYGVKKTALISAAGALPFILLGNKIMIVSLIGIMLFSMTMSITLALNVSVLKGAPGLAFGYTTTALFIGTLPIFFISVKSYLLSSIILSVFTALSFAALAIIIGKDEKISEQHQ